MECSVIKAAISEKGAARAACKSAQMREDGSVHAECHLVYLPFWYATYRCEVKRFLLPARTGLLGAGADAFIGFVSLIAGLPEVELADIPQERLLPRRYDWSAVDEMVEKQVIEYFVHKFRRVPKASLEQFSLIYRPTWVCGLGTGSSPIIRCIDAHSGDPLYYLDNVAEEIAELAKSADTRSG